MSAINNNLNNAFRHHRVIFWYDETGDSREQFDAVTLPGVEKVIMDYNSFAIKYRILRLEKEQKFLLYFPYKCPEDSANWLLDIQLSNFVFDTDPSALRLQEMNLDYTYKEFIHSHIEFFAAKDRREQFAEIFNVTDSHRILRHKMVSMVFGTENYDLQTLVQAYANSYFTNLDKLNKDLERYNLKDFLWEEIANKYKYEKEGQNIYEFIIEVFENSFSLTKKTGLTFEARLILSSWRDSYTMRESYQKMSEKISLALKIESLLQDCELDTIIEDEVFELVDQKIIYELINLLLTKRITYDKLNQIIKARESTFWFPQYKNIYQSLDHAFSLFELIENVSFKYGNAEDAVKSYVSNDYKIDLHYRKFYENFHASKKQNIIKRLIERVENMYVNEWLFTGGNAYQNRLNDKKVWRFESMIMQRSFFDVKVKPILNRQKVVVIISDALRYECGVELSDEINRISKFNSELDMMISAIPSYTQLGMASLLSHKRLSFEANSDNVLVDGLSSLGTDNREKVLQYHNQKNVKTIQARDFLKLKSAERREVIKSFDIIYMYSNKIDKVGDDKMTENEVFSAASQEISNIKDLVVAVTSANASRVLVTSDHGFIYQDSVVRESDFIESKYKGDTFKENRRFVLGKNLYGDNTAMSFKSNDLFIDSDVDVLIAKGINRYKVKGAGSRFIHGGASLQETIIPLLDITKGREETVKTVEVDIIQSHNRITTNNLPIEFVQSEPVGEKVLPIEIRAYIEAKDGKVLSNVFTYIFDFTGDENRQRSKQFTFHMISDAADNYRGQMVELVLQIPIEKTTLWQEYKRFGYNLNISFTNDFD